MISTFSVVASLLGGRVRRLPALDRVPRVSVVIPCYNYGRYLEQCADSALFNQPGVDLEVIIVDDGSADDSLERARLIAARDDRVRIIAHEANKGAIATYNDGLAEATGDYAVLLSADDLLAPGALSRAARLFEAHPSVGLVYGGVVNFSEHARPAREGKGSYVVWPGRRWLERRCRVGYNVIASPEAVVRLSVFRAIGPYRADLPHTGDLAIWLRAASVSDIGFLLDCDQAYYRRHAANMHRLVFKGGSHAGGLLDLEHRWRSFESALSEPPIEESTHLLDTARRSIAGQALESACRGFARYTEDFPVADYEALALSMSPALAVGLFGFLFSLRQRRLAMPLRTLWMAPAALFRARQIVVTLFSRWFGL